MTDDTIREATFCNFLSILEIFPIEKTALHLIKISARIIGSSKIIHYLFLNLAVGVLKETNDLDHFIIFTNIEINDGSQNKGFWNIKIVIITGMKRLKVS